ncbi:MAG: mechanosensitive ion channel, partial [Chloroflexi bacterium]|nr:mechanosensitive ion channel [Chloroflexota bacterium]
MLEQVFPEGLELNNILGAIAILAGSALLGWLARYLLRRLCLKAQARTTTVLDEYLLGAVATPIFVAVAILGIYFGLAYLPLAPSVDQEIPRWLFVALVATGILAALSGIDAFLKWYGHEVAAQTTTTLDDRLVPVLRFLTRGVGGFLGVLLILRMLGIQHLGINAWLTEHGARILIIVVLTLLMFFGHSRAIPVAVKKTVQRGMVGHPQDEVDKRSETLVTVLVTTGQVIILGAGSLMLLNELLPGRIGPLLAGVGVAGIAIGFGAQSLVKDVINGLFIIMEGQYCVGDVAKVADISGLVIDINLRRTVLRDADGIVHFVPNGEIKVASNF